jgi:multidrug efflux pump
MHRFFLDRPIFASVIAIVVTLAGSLAVLQLPISQFPPVTPPTIQVDCNYPGASAEVVSKTIAAPIEQRVNGVEKMLYMSSQSTSDGSYTLTVTFETGTDLNLAQVQVQNRVNLALPELPEAVRVIGVTARKRSPEILLTVSINSPDGSYDQLYLSNYSALHLREELVRIHGISEVLIFGQRDYSMRVWVDPDKLEARGVTVLDVMNALRGQNREVALGHLGGGGIDPTHRSTQLTVTTLGRLETPEQFANVIVTSGADGQLIRVKDVATVELGARSSDISNKFDNKPTVGLAVFLEPDGNALAIAEEVKKRMAEYGKEFPEGIRYEIGYDTTPYISASIREVFRSLRDSVILVAVVVLMFLQSWRSALIPLATVPVAIVGTFAAMYAVGFGLNNLTLFGLVLSVGIVVDDAIVVVEAVQQQIERGYSPREATLRAMDEVSGPVIAVGVVLSAVFLPCMFFPGIVGLFFRQFALTIAISTMISTFLSLSLSPALAVVLLKPKTARPDLVTRVVNFAFGWFFWLFNKGFDLSGQTYGWLVGRLIRVPLLVVIVYGGLIAVGYRGYLQIPSGFIPTQDKGYLIASVQLVDAASAEQTRAALERITQVALDTPGVKHVNAVAGNSFALSAYGSNFGSMFIILDDFEERRAPHLYASVIAAELNNRINTAVPKAVVNVFPAPAVPGLGRAGGVRMMVQDRGEIGAKMLEGQTRNLIDAVVKQTIPDALTAPGATPPPLFQTPLTVFRTNSPQLRVIVNDAECVSAGVNPLDVYATMQATLGQRYVNDFNRFGRTFQVNVQAQSRYRDQIEDVKRLRVRNRYGELVPIGALAEVKTVSGPLVITRYNMYPAASITASVAPGISSGVAIGTFEQLADRELPTNMGYEWTELTFIERRSRDTGFAVFLLAVVVVFLVLAALYESWALPLAVILVVPTCVLSSLIGVYLARQDINLFTQVGFVVLIGLACKNAILIVEYAKLKRDAGADRRTAILAACRLRLRPILMTSFAFILGVTTLAFSDGAGSEMRRALGITVFAGMLGVTVFGVFLTPVFFVLVDWIVDMKGMKSKGVRAVFRGLRWVVAFGWVRTLARWNRARQGRAPQATPDRPAPVPMAVSIPAEPHPNGLISDSFAITPRNNQYSSPIDPRERSG